MASLLQPPQKQSKSDPLQQILDTLTPIQQKLLLDEARFKVARCGRRSGKTFALAAVMVYTALKYPKSNSVYFGLTRDAAKKAVWQPLMDLLEKLNIGAEVSESSLTVKFKNGAEFGLYGADMANVKDRFRGRKHRLVCVDECAFYAAVDAIVKDVLMPTLADDAGTLILASSPGILPSGMFYEADQGKFKDFWSRYSWTMDDNPIFQKPAKDPRYSSRAEEEYDIICTMNFNGDRDSPAFKREYRGLWVFDQFALIYPLPADNVLPDLLPIARAEYAIGVNLASAGTQGFVVIRYSELAASCDVIEAYSCKTRTLDRLSAEISRLAAKYKSNRVLAFLGKHKVDIIDEFRVRYGSPIVASDYPKVAFYQSIVSTDMAIGSVNVLYSCSALLEEFSKIVQDDKGDEIPGQTTLLADAFFACYINLYLRDLRARKVAESDEDKMLRQLIEEHEREEQDNDYN